MSIIAMVLGDSGSGKSTSLRNFKKGEALVIQTVNKPLPFRNELETIATDKYPEVLKAMTDTKCRTIIVDDSQYLMANEFMRRATETGFQKFTDIGRNFWALLANASQLPADKTVYFLHHTELNPNGKEKAKTIGKMLDEKITLEGLFTIVLLSECTDEGYFFRTKSNGADTVKTPMGLFKEEKIDNDLKAVDKAIREFYGIK